MAERKLISYARPDFYSLFMLKKIKKFVKAHFSAIIIAIGIILISSLSFALGLITAKLIEKQPLKIEKPTYESSQELAPSLRHYP